MARVRQFVRPNNNTNEDAEKESTTCRWVHLPSLEWPRRLCGRSGYPYCSEHQRELAAMDQADSWEEIFAQGVGFEEPGEKPRLFVVVNTPRH
jgi:hypothetical protein